jgi:hypothetical protein
VRDVIISAFVVLAVILSLTVVPWALNAIPRPAWLTSRRALSVAVVGTLAVAALAVLPRTPSKDERQPQATPNTQEGRTIEAWARDVTALCAAAQPAVQALERQHEEVPATDTKTQLSILGNLAEKLYSLSRAVGAVPSPSNANEKQRALDWLEVYAQRSQAMQNGVNASEQLESTGGISGIFGGSEVSNWDKKQVESASEARSKAAALNITCP